MADRHVHIWLADPGTVLLGGVTAVRDRAWVPQEIFALANASELPSFTGPVIPAAGPMLTVPCGYPTASAWAPAGTGRELDGRRTPPRSSPSSRTPARPRSRCR